MRLNKATKELIQYFRVLGQYLSLKPDSETGMWMPATLIDFFMFF
jgi:hypothetical protein